MSRLIHVGCSRVSAVTAVMSRLIHVGVLGVCCDRSHV